jgi:protein-S-isoprenylcysteine O-methyltransferase Ste14
VTWVVFAYHLASRLAYVLYVGIALSRQERSGWLSRRYGAEPGFRRFRRAAAAVMLNDGASFVLLCVASGGTLPVALPRAATLAVGAVLGVVGVGTKLWAGATLGAAAYYWRNFFPPAEQVVPAAAGPYRYLRNPMYTVGYLQTYGLALATGSLFGLIAALFDQVAILAFYRTVELPHFERARGAPLDSDARPAQNEGSPSRRHAP